MTDGDARRLYGPPATEKTSSNDSYFGYLAGTTRIELAHIKEGSPLAGARETRSVFAYPDQPIEQVFSR